MRWATTMPISARALAMSSPMMRRRGRECVVDGAADEVPDDLAGAVLGDAFDVVGRPVGSIEPAVCTRPDFRNAAVVMV